MTATGSAHTDSSRGSGRRLIGWVVVAGAVAAVAIRPDQAPSFFNGVILGVVALFAIVIVRLIVRLMSRSKSARAAAVVVMLLVALRLGISGLYLGGGSEFPVEPAPTEPAPPKRTLYVPYTHDMKINVDDSSIALIETITFQPDDVEYESESGKELRISTRSAASCIDEIVNDSWSYVSNTDRMYQRKTDASYQLPDWPPLSRFDVRVSSFDAGDFCRVRGNKAEVASVVVRNEGPTTILAEAERHAILAAETTQVSGVRETVTLDIKRGLEMPLSQRVGVSRIDFANDEPDMSSEFALLARWTRSDLGQRMAALTPQGAVAAIIGFLSTIILAVANKKIYGFFFRRTEESGDADNSATRGDDDADDRPDSRPEGDAGYT